MKLKNHSNGQVASTEGEPEVLRTGGRVRGVSNIHVRGAGPFDELLCRLQAKRDRKSAGCAMIGLIGCEERAGVTTMAANLAVRASELGFGPVLLVEVHRGKTLGRKRLETGTRAGTSRTFFGVGITGRMSTAGADARPSGAVGGIASRRRIGRRRRGRRRFIFE